jgi:NADPH-dependent 2,4-dienoyl-CoA reductase/sulfur reductase-like enzyme
MTPKPIICAVNPMSAMTSELPSGVIPRAPKSGRIAVVGGGPAGITAMETLLERGHQVTLYEKSDRLGGHVADAAVPPFKGDVADYLRWLQRTADKCRARGARILLNQAATPELLALENYDGLVLALGAEPIVPSIPGIKGPNVAWAPDAEAGKVSVGERVAVIGGSAVGMEAALDFSLQGKEVFVVELLDEAAAGGRLHMSAGGGAAELKRLFREREIPVYYGKGLAEVKPDGILVEDALTRERTFLPCDTVLLAVGLRPRLAEAEAMRRCAPETSVFVVGDGKKAASICEAVNEAFQVCLHI